MNRNWFGFVSFGEALGKERMVGMLMPNHEQADMDFVGKPMRKISDSLIGH